MNVSLATAAPWWRPNVGQKLLIRGGRPLVGTYPISGVKNAVLPLMVSALLTPHLQKLAICGAQIGRRSPNRSGYSAATAIACFSPGMVKPSLLSLAIMSLPAFSSVSTSGGRTGVQAASSP